MQVRICSCVTHKKTARFCTGLNSSCAKRSAAAQLHAIVMMMVSCEEHTTRTANGCATNSIGAAPDNSTANSTSHCAEGRTNKQDWQNITSIEAGHLIIVMMVSAICHGLLG